MASNNNYKYISFNNLSTQQQKLAFFENQIVSGYIAPYRNKHIFNTVLAYDSQHCFYYSNNYTYGSDSINTYQQVITNTDSDRYAVFAIDKQDDKNLIISYTQER